MHSRPSPKIRELEEVRSTAPTSVARRERKVIYPPHSVPCYVSGATASRLSQRGKAGITVRIDNAAPHLDLRTQLVDDPAKADFVLVDGDAGDITCRGATAIENIRVDNRARKPDLTAALWRAPVRYKIFMRSARFSDQDAAALFAVSSATPGRPPSRTIRSPATERIAALNSALIVLAHGLAPRPLRGME